MDDVTRPRLAVYIDGCNLFNGMREARWRHCYWLDLRELAELLTDDGVSRVVRVVYFTARITGNPEKNKRHSTYISAVQARGGVDVIEGYFQNERVFCGGCKVPFDLPKEKQADTGIATEMVADAFLDRWDKACVVSGDSDLVPPIKCIKRQFPNKRVTAVFPPRRVSDALKAAAAGSCYHLSERKLVDCQMPDKVMKPNSKPDLPAITLQRPVKWK